MWRQNHYRAVVDTAADAILVIDEAGMIQSSNPSTQRIFGYSHDELIGQTIGLLAPGEPASAFGDTVDRGDRTLASIRRGAWGRRKNGGLFPIEASIAEWVADDGQKFLSVVLRDVEDYRAAKDALLESQEWLRTVSDTALAGLVVIDRDHRVRFANRAYGVLFGLSFQVVVGMHLRDVLPDIYDTVMRPRLDAAFTGLRRSHQFVYPKNGDPADRRHLAETYEPSPGSAADRVVVVVVTDVTELKRSEIALRASRDLLQSVLDGTLDAIFAKDALGRYVAINESGALILGVDRNDVIGRSDDELRGPQAAKRYVAEDRAVMRSGAPLLSELTIMLSGRQTDLLVSKRPWAGPDGVSGGVVGIVRDVTEQRQIAAERKDLARQLMGAQEAERLRLARELHDQVGQDLAGLSLGLKDLEGGLRSKKALALLAKLRKSTDRIASNLHNVARELRPTSLEDLGLRGAIASHISEWNARFGLPVDAFLDELDLAQLGSDQELAIYRCVQEALTNILKHARATNVSVVAQCAPSRVRVIVEDNGMGFDADQAFPTHLNGRLGLLGMRERMNHVDGVLTVESTLGRGTSIFISLANGGGKAS